MALRDKLVQKVTPMLEPGEQVQAVFVGQTASQYWAMLGFVWFLAKNRYYTVAVTDRRIALFEGGRMTLASPKTLAASLPRHTKLGPATGLWWKTQIGGVQLHVHKRFHKDVAQADAIVGVSDEGLVQTTNPAASSMFGQSMSEMIGHPLEQYVPGLSISALREMFAELTRYGSTARVSRRPVRLSTPSENNSSSSLLVPASLVRASMFLSSSDMIPMSP